MKPSRIIAIIIMKVAMGNALYCYRCDSLKEDDCRFYPAPISAYENCESKPEKLLETRRHTIELSAGQPEPTETLYIRYRYRLCPLLERTVQQLVPLTPNPLEEGSFVCGKAVTATPDGGVRVRRGCMPDLFLSGTDACVQVHPHGHTDVACFCTSDFCNSGNTLAPTIFNLFSQATTAVAVSLYSLSLN